MFRRLFLSLACATLLSGQPQRIVSTTPSITEILYALGLGDRVAGVTRFCRYPPEAQLKPKIGDYTNPNIEAIAALKPDLVIIQTNPARLRERLSPMHLRVIEVDQQNIAGIYESIRAIGEAAGVPDRAEKLIGSIRAGLDALRAHAVALKPVRMMFVVGRSQGRLDGLVVVGRASFLNEVLHTAGGENIFHDALAPYPKVSLEEVMSRNPEVILDMGDMADTVGVTDQHKRDVVALWDRVATVDAVKHHQVFAIASDFYIVPGPRVVESARSIFEMLHPEHK
jgi:iron complex transport system substrate-binding protein